MGAMNCGIKALNKLKGTESISAFSLIHLAKDNGINLFIFKVDPADVAKVPRPAILHSDDHFEYIEDGKPLPLQNWSGYVLSEKPMGKAVTYAEAKSIKGSKKKGKKSLGEKIGKIVVGVVTVGAAAMGNPLAIAALTGAVVGAGTGAAGAALTGGDVGKAAEKGAFIGGATGGIMSGAGALAATPTATGTSVGAKLAGMGQQVAQQAIAHPAIAGAVVGGGTGALLSPENRMGGAVQGAVAGGATGATLSGLKMIPNPASLATTPVAGAAGAGTAAGTGTATGTATGTVAKTAGGGMLGEVGKTAGATLAVGGLSKAMNPPQSTVGEYESLSLPESSTLPGAVDVPQSQPSSAPPSATKPSQPESGVGEYKPLSVPYSTTLPGAVDVPAPVVNKPMQTPVIQPPVQQTPANLATSPAAPLINAGVQAGANTIMNPPAKTEPKPFFDATTKQNVINTGLQAGIGAIAGSLYPKAETPSPTATADRYAQFQESIKNKKLDEATQKELFTLVDTPLSQLAPKFTLDSEKLIRQQNQIFDKQRTNILRSAAQAGQNARNSSDVRKALQENENFRAQTISDLEKQIQYDGMQQAVQVKQDALRSSIQSGQFDLDKAYDLAAASGQDAALKRAVQQGDYENFKTIVTGILGQAFPIKQR